MNPFCYTRTVLMWEWGLLTHCRNGTHSINNAKNKNRQRQDKAHFSRFVLLWTCTFDCLVVRASVHTVVKEEDIQFEHHFDPFISLLFTVPDFSHFFSTGVTEIFKS